MTPSLFPSSGIAATSLLLLLLRAGSAVASPAPSPVVGPREADATSSSTSYSLEPTDAWVSVGTDGHAETTVTPVLTTISGVPTVLSASPTTQPLLRTTTSTTTEQPHAVGTSGAGAFPACHNTDGAYAPFCAPAAGSLLRPGTTYYITWDPAFFAADTRANTTVTVTGTLYDVDSGALTDDTTFASGSVAASQSFYAWTVPSSILANVKNHARGVNVSIAMSYTTNSSSASTAQGPVVNAANPPPVAEPHHLSSGAGLYIGLPVTFGFILLMLIGTCMWNRHRRRLNLGDNVMSRRRFGDLLPPQGFRKGYGIRKSRRERVGDNGLASGSGAISLDGKDAIPLQSRGVDRYSEEDYDDDDGHHQDNGQAYRDTPSGLSVDPYRANNRPRRDSDALGSLAGTPTDERFGSSGGQPSAAGPSGSTGNAFRDELARQARMD